MTEINYDPRQAQGEISKDEPAGQPQSPWQPIETKPRDHFPVLVYGLYGQLVAFLDVTWMWWPFPAGEDGPLDYVPTHWQPLPAPPHTRPDRQCK